MLTRRQTRNSIIATLTLFFAATQFAHAGRKLYVIVAADKDDASIGRYCSTDAGNIGQLFSLNIHRDEIHLIDVPASQLTTAGIRSVIRNSGIGAEDAVLFYYSGHGHYARDGKQYFVVGGRQIGRESITTELQSRGAGLTVLISDACFNFNDVPPPGGVTSRQVMLGPTQPLFRKLFFETNGFINLSSCQKDEKAATHPDSSQGSVFTKALVDVLNLKRSMAGVTWQSIINEVGQETSRQFQLQHPDGVTMETSDDFINQRSQTVAKLAMNTFAHDPGTGIAETPGTPDSTPGPSTPVESTDLQIRIDPYSGRTNETLVTYKYYPETGRTITQRGRPQFKGIASVVKASDDTEYWRWPQVKDPDIVNGDPTYVQKISRRPDGAPPSGTPHPTPTPRPGTKQIASAKFGLTVANKAGRGVVIRKVTPGGPATKCLGTDGQTWRLEAGDSITRINGRDINNVNQFASAMRTASGTMSVQVQGHDGSWHQMTVTLAGGTPDPGPMPGKGPRFGVTVSTLAGMGVVITSVVPSSPATKCSHKGTIYRLEVGDLITKVNGQRITSEASFARAVRGSGRVMRFRVKDQFRRER